MLRTSCMVSISTAFLASLPRFSPFNEYLVTSSGPSLGFSELRAEPGRGAEFDSMAQLGEALKVMAVARMADVNSGLSCCLLYYELSSVFLWKCW